MRRLAAFTYALASTAAIGAPASFEPVVPASHAGHDIPTFEITVKPLRNGGEQVNSIEVSERIVGNSGAAPSPDLQAALSAPGVRKLADGMADVHATDAIGELPLSSVDDPTTAGGDAKRHWKPTRVPAYPMIVTYHVTPRPPAAGGPPFAMKAAGGGVAGIGRAFLILPDPNAFGSVRLQWNLSDLDRGSIAAASAGDAPLAIPTAKIGDMWMLAGPALVRGKNGPSGFEGYALGRGQVDSAEILAWANRAYDILSKTFRYQGQPRYGFFLRILPAASSGTGTATNGGSLVSLGNTLTPDQGLSYFHDVIFHEMTHQWVGEFAGEEPWFSEGLTVYLSEELRMRIGMATPQEGADGLNRVIRNYYTSPARNWSEAKIEAAPFNQQDVRLVPYGRGVLYFASLDEHLRAKLGGKRSLAEVLYPLFVSRQNGHPLNQAAWEAMLRRELGGAAVAEFRETIIDGTRTALPSSTAFGPLLHRVETREAPSGQQGQNEIFEWRPLPAAPAAAGSVR